jgi:hypothetical protein
MKSPFGLITLNNAAEDEQLQRGAVAVMKGLNTIPDIGASSFLEMDAI